MLNPYANIFLNLGGIFGYRYFFLMDDENQTVEITEDKEIDFNLVRKRLECGESVFITPINKPQSDSQARRWDDRGTG